MKRAGKLIIGLAFLMINLIGAARCWAEIDVHWNVPSGDFDTAASWQEGVVPGRQEGQARPNNGSIRNGGTCIVAGDTNREVGYLSVGDLSTLEVKAGTINPVYGFLLFSTGSKVVQTNGVIRIPWLEITAGGEYRLTGGQMQFNLNSDPSLRFKSGKFLLGDAKSTGLICENGNPLPVTFDVGAEAEFIGWGKLQLPNHSLQNSGKVIADGYGTNRSLDFSSLKSAVINAGENTGDKGWFARNGGKLILPGVKVADGDSACNWGEDSKDVDVDLVNSIRLSFSGVQMGAELIISLLAGDNGSVPKLPDGFAPAGVWNFKMGPEFMFNTAGKADLTFRYDDAALLPGKTGNDLKIFGYADGAWSALNASADASKKQISTRGVTSIARFYAVGTAR